MPPVAELWVVDDCATRCKKDGDGALVNSQLHADLKFNIWQLSLKLVKAAAHQSTY